MHLSSEQTYHAVYVWVTIVYVAYTISLALRGRKARQSIKEAE